MLHKKDTVIKFFEKNKKYYGESNTGKAYKQE